MRIVDVNAFYTPSGGGVRTYVERKLAALPALGHEIVILAPGEREETQEIAPGAHIVTIPSPRFPLDRRYGYFDDEKALHRALDRLKPDFVEASSPWASAAMVARWNGAAPRALVMHADPLSAYAYRWFGPIAPRAVIDRGFDRYWRHLRRLDAGFDHVVVASRDLARRMAEGGLRNLRTVPMGVEPGVFDPALRDEALRASLLRDCELGDNATLLLTIGRFAPEKRIPMVIGAALAAGCRAPIGLIAVGEGRDQAAVMRASGHSPHVRILAPIRSRERMARLMASADALVHGCEAETFCMVAAEARASGLPLIVPDRGGASDHHRHGAGFRYAATDRADLVRTLHQLVDADGAALRARAAEAAPAVRTMDRHFTELAALYEASSELRDAA
ncbi:glycosyltransferase [Stakelama marina]|uniref:Glycosyltransferase n=1 Tax=Stakelama marina TaxID=2826939 RepID=A0A8T4IBC8_9SPHN|nr:glycosyltransferase [Stakelama marina]MBR0551723.1 glycosyltransferase [Stakelama marina]